MSLDAYEPAAPRVQEPPFPPIAWADDAAFRGGIGNVASSAAKRYWSSSNLFDREQAKRLRHPLFAERAPLTEFRRMQIIGDQFPLPLVDPLVIAKIDAVCLAIERAHGIGGQP